MTPRSGPRARLLLLALFLIASALAAQAGARKSARRAQWDAGHHQPTTEQAARLAQDDAEAEEAHVAWLVSSCPCGEELVALRARVAALESAR